MREFGAILRHSPTICRRSILTDGRESPHTPPQHGPFRAFLRLLVEADSSRSAFNRIRAIVLLLALLAAFAALGYGLPTWLSRYF
jgi:hypothetical protein